MPEGDSIVGAARRLTVVLTGRTLIRVELRRAGPAPAAGVRVERIDAHGKHLLIRFDDGTTLRTHLRMSGRWDVYGPGERWRRPAHRARVVLETDEHVTVVCFDAPEVELLRNEREEHARLGHLGPDLCRADADIGEAVARLGQIDQSTELGVALLDQRIACGVGNVYKSEVCFACRVHPFTPVGRLDPDTRTTIVTTAARLLAANLGPGRRATFNGGYAVYRRARRPCPRCGTLIATRGQGEPHRSTYWCPRCQPS